MPGLRDQKGFTLAEMMTVTAVLAIMAAVAVPNLKAYTLQSRLNGAARQVMSELMGSRMKAVSQNSKVKVFFSDHEYRICDDANGDGTVDDGEGTVLTRDIQNDYPGVTLSATANPVFLLNGTAIGATITISNGVATKSVSVASTGRVLIQ